MRKLSLGDVLG